LNPASGAHAAAARRSGGRLQLQPRASANHVRIEEFALGPHASEPEPARHQCYEGAARFEPRERCPQAEVGAEAEGHVPARTPLGIEAVGVRPTPLQFGTLLRKEV